VSVDVTSQPYCSYIFGRNLYKIINMEKITLYDHASDKMYDMMLSSDDARRASGKMINVNYDLI